MTEAKHSDTQKCQHPQCEKQIARGMFGCTVHWFQLPKTLRTPISAAWRRFMAADSDDLKKTILALRKAHEAAVQYWKENPAK